MKMNKKELSYKLVKNYLEDFLKIKFNINRSFLKPLFFTYYITLSCNFNCSYCGFARNKSSRKYDELDTKGIIELMKIIRKECPNIYFTGGEPLLRNDIVEVVRTCKELGFKSISINTNMSLIHKKMEILDNITNLIASFDIVDEEEYSKLLNVPIETVKQLKNNIIDCAKLQKKKDFTMTINCVVTEKTICHAREVMYFCFENNIRFAIVPAEANEGRINPLLKNNREYQQLILDVMEAKKQSKNVFCSQKYLDIIYDFKHFDCYPTLTPHIYPNGDLLYPCQPLLKVASNLLEVNSYNAALRIGIEKFGKPPICKDRCHKACYIEPPNLIKNLKDIIKL